MTNAPVEPADELSIDESPIKAKPWKKIPLNKRIGQYGRDSCEKVEKVYFLKTSKTGSTTMANILMRFGYRREGTNFLMGEECVFFSIFWNIWIFENFGNFWIFFETLKKDAKRRPILHQWVHAVQRGHLLLGPGH